MASLPANTPPMAPRAYSCSVDYFLLRIGSRRNLYAYLFLSACKPYQVPQGVRKAYFLVHSFAVLMNAALSFFNCCIAYKSLRRSRSLLSTLDTYRCYVRFKRVIDARIVQLFLDDGKHCNNNHIRLGCGSPHHSSPEARVMDGFH